MENSFTVGLIVNNRHGVLNRIAGMYGKRGYNIDSLSVGETENPAFSRMTIVSTGDAYTRDQVVKQLNKLYDVRLAVLLEAADSISVEHLLIKLKTNGGGNGAIMALINDYSGKVINIGEGFVVADLTGSPDKIQAFIEKCIPHGILELCRSGALSIASGTQNILNVTNIQGEE